MQLKEKYIERKMTLLYWTLTIIGISNLLPYLFQHNNFFNSNIEQSIVAAIISFIAMLITVVSTIVSTSQDKNNFNNKVIFPEIISFITTCKNEYYRRNKSE